MVPESFDEEVIKQIYDLGHEIGYHYEDVSVTAQRRKGTVAQWQKGIVDEELLAKIAIKNFKENLEKFRKILPVETICMHGSPLSRWDNRLLWKYYDYRDFGIVGEPYFDIDFEKVLYLTDTGRLWDGGAVAIRDKVTGKEEMMRRGGNEEKGRFKVPEALRTPSLSGRLHSTFEIIAAAKGTSLPDQIMLTVHPQRWDDRLMPWIRELVWQNFKNIVKRVVVENRRVEISRVSDER